MNISFHGADRNVTGSCHLVQCAGKHIQVDCALYQGQKEITDENSGDFGFDPGCIDYLLLIHAHLDHSCPIPMDCQTWFKGEIITNSACRELTRVVMLESA